MGSMRNFVSSFSSPGDRGRLSYHRRLLQLCLPRPGQREGQRSDAHVLPGGAQAEQQAVPHRQRRAPGERVHPRQRVHQAEPRPHSDHLRRHQDPEPEHGQTDHLHQHHQVPALCPHGNGVTDAVSMVTVENKKMRVEVGKWDGWQQDSSSRESLLKEEKVEPFSTLLLLSVGRREADTLIVQWEAWTRARTAFRTARGSPRRPRTLGLTLHTRALFVVSRRGAS